MAQLDWYLRANVKLRHLQLLVALDDMRSVGRVADYLNVTQPAISKTLAGLESGLEVKLFERTARGMEPTEHGSCLIRHARNILGEMVSLRSELLDITEGRVTKVAMGVLPAATASLVPEFIARLEADFADVTASVREGTMESMLPMLRAGDLDLIVGNLPPRPMGVEFGTELLHRDPLVLVTRVGHPLTDEPEIGWQMLSHYPMVLPPIGTFTRNLIDDFMLQHEINVPRRHIDSVSTLTNVGVLQRTDSVGCLSREVAQYFQNTGVLRILPLALPNIDMHVGLVWMVERKMTKAQQQVRALFREIRDELLHQRDTHHVGAQVSATGLALAL